jgi:hypothetical protein
LTVRRVAMGNGREEPDEGAADTKRDRDERADEADRESFPASDAPAGWSGRDDPVGPSRDDD